MYVCTCVGVIGVQLYLQIMYTNLRVHEHTHALSLSFFSSPPFFSSASPSLPPSLSTPPSSKQGGNRPMMADDSDEEFDPVGGAPLDSELDKVP